VKTRFPLDEHRRRVAIADSLSVSCIDAGPENPQQTLLLLHGAGGRNNQWQDQIGYFSDRFRCIAPDMRGHGHSDFPVADYTLNEFMDDLDRLVDVLQLPERFVVVAHSFGGALAITYAATRPERVAKLVLIATSTVIPLNPMLKVLFAMPPWLLDLARRAIPGRISCPARVLRKFIPGAVFPWNGWGLLPSITAPTLIILGERDRVVPRDSAMAMTTQLQNCQVEIVRYAAHMPILERPAAVNRALERFLEERVRSWRGTIEEVRGA